MKKILIGFLTFIIGIAFVSAKTYQFDLTEGEKEVERESTNYFDNKAYACLSLWSENNSDGYSKNGYNDNLGYYHWTMVNNNGVNLFRDDEIDPGSIITILDATGEHNFIADISNINDPRCPMPSFGYDKIEVLFESDEDIPVIDEYVVDIANFSMEDSDNPTEKETLDTMLIELLLFIENDDILPDVSNPAAVSWPLTISKNGKDLIIFNTTNAGPEVSVVDGLTENDNFSLTREFLDGASILMNFDQVADPLPSFLPSMSKITYMVSPIPETTPEGEEETPTVTPDEEDKSKKEDKNKDDNPKTVDNVFGYLSFLGVSVIVCGFIHIKTKQHN